jgi:hypothetical protein
VYVCMCVCVCVCVCARRHTCDAQGETHTKRIDAVPGSMQTGKAVAPTIDFHNWWLVHLVWLEVAGERGGGVQKGAVLGQRGDSLLLRRQVPIVAECTSSKE